MYQDPPAFVTHVSDEIGAAVKVDPKVGPGRVIHLNVDAFNIRGFKVRDVEGAVNNVSNHPLADAVMSYSGSRTQKQAVSYFGNLREHGKIHVDLVVDDLRRENCLDVIGVSHQYRRRRGWWGRG